MNTRRERLRSSTIDEIKHIARQQMAAEGAVNISLRGIAREMGMTVTALYHYFPSYDDLLTVLIADAFHALADTIEAAQASGQTIPQRLWHGLLAYRQHALQHPHEFALIYGTPIPNYHAPRDITVPATLRTQTLLATLIEQGIRDGSIQPIAQPTATVTLDALHQQIVQSGLDVRPETLDILTRLWIRGHGIVMLELFGHLQPVVGDVDAFYRSELTAAFAHLGISSP